MPRKPHDYGSCTGPLNQGIRSNPPGGPDDHTGQQQPTGWAGSPYARRSGQRKHLARPAPPHQQKEVSLRWHDTNITVRSHCH